MTEIEENYYIKTLLGKRVFDIAVSSFLLVVLSPMILLFILLIFIENVATRHPFDPIFYTETRVSQGKRFRLIKFHIFNQSLLTRMKCDNIFIHTKDLEKNGDMKVIGHMLKQIYMDELPQLINVLLGDMSLVGPRPLNLEVYDDLKIRGLATQSVLKSGLTGNFQAYKGTEKTAKELDYEYLNYYKSKSHYKIILFDIKILLQTIKVVLRARGI